MIAVINMLGMMPASWISDKFGRKATIVPAALLISGSVVCWPFAESYDQFWWLMVVYACGNSILGTTPTASLTDISTDETRGQALAMYRISGDMGMLLGAGSMGMLAVASSIDVALWTNGIVLGTAGPCSC